MDVQKKCDRYFEQLKKGEINRIQYVNKIDSVYNEIDKKGLVDRRRDNRTLGEFALQIYDNTIREKFLLDEWLKLLPGFPSEIRFEDNGIANDGRLIINTKQQSGRADYKLHVRDCTYQLELKFNPTQRFSTYKVADLNNYVGQPDIMVLTIMGNTKMIGPNGDPYDLTPLAIPEGLMWFIMCQQEILKLMNVGEAGRHWGFGNKETVRIYSVDYEKVFKLHTWEGQSDW